MCNKGIYSIYIPCTVTAPRAGYTFLPSHASTRRDAAVAQKQKHGLETTAADGISTLLPSIQFGIPTHAQRRECRFPYSLGSQRCVLKRPPSCVRPTLSLQRSLLFERFTRSPTSLALPPKMRSAFGHSRRSVAVLLLLVEDSTT